MTLVYVPLESQTFDNIVENVDRATDADLGTNVTGYLGFVRIQRYNATTYNLLGERFLYELVSYATEEDAIAAWQGT